MASSPLFDREICLQQHSLTLQLLSQLLHTCDKHYYITDDVDTDDENRGNELFELYIIYDNDNELTGASPSSEQETAEHPSSRACSP